MHPIRIIPCLDIKDAKVVKGKNFVDLKNVGEPLQLAKDYNKQQADELIFLDTTTNNRPITATNQNRDTLIDLASSVARELFIPFTIGGGISSVMLAEKIIKAGADKISINSAAIKTPNLINQISDQFGSQSVVLAMDVKKNNNTWRVYSHAGKEDTGMDALEWAEEVQSSLLQAEKFFKSTTLASLISKQGIIRIGCIKDWQIELKNSIHLAGIFLDEIEFPKDFLFE